MRICIMQWTFCFDQERRVPPPVPKKPSKSQAPLVRDRSLESTERQRHDARKRLMSAKRAASVRQNSATESADSIEIYIPEAQTRLWSHHKELWGDIIYLYIFMTQSYIYNISSSLVWKHNHVYMLFCIFLLFLYSLFYFSHFQLSWSPFSGCAVSGQFSEAMILHLPLSRILPLWWSINTSHFHWTFFYFTCIK